MKKSKQLHGKVLLMRISLGIILLALYVGLTFIAIWIWIDKTESPLFFLLSIGWFLGVLTIFLILIPEKLIHLLYILRNKFAKQNGETFDDLVVSEDLAVKKRRVAVIFTFVFSALMFGIAIIMGII